MITAKNHASSDRSRKLPSPRQQAPPRGLVAEEAVDAEAPAILRTAGYDRSHLMSALVRADPSTRSRVVRRLQRDLGNHYVQRLVESPAHSRRIQRADTESQPTAEPFHVGSDVEAAMRADVDRIVAILQQQVIPAADERLVLDYVKNWADWDDQFRPIYHYQGTPYLDRFLLMLKTRDYKRRTARLMWVEQHALVYDDLWHEIEGDRLEQFKQIVARSRTQGTTGPTTEREESAWSFIGKREALGFWGVLKGMGTTIVGGTVDTVIWATWKSTGWPLNQVLQHLGVKKEDLRADPAYIKPFLEKKFDETAKFFSSQLGVDLNEKLVGEIGLYQFGEAGGKVVGALTLAGESSALTEAGGAQRATEGAKATATAVKLLGVAQAAQQSEQLYDSVKQLREGDAQKGIPPLSWSDIVKRPDVWAQVVGVVGGAVGAAGSFSAAGSEAAKAFTRLGIGANATQIAVLVAAYRAVDDDPTLKTPGERGKRKADLLAALVTTGVLTVDMRFGKAFQEAWDKNLQRGTGQTTTQQPGGGPAGLQSDRPVTGGGSGSSEQGAGSNGGAAATSGSPDWLEPTAYPPTGDVPVERPEGFETGRTTSGAGGGSSQDWLEPTAYPPAGEVKSRRPRGFEPTTAAPIGRPRTRQVTSEEQFYGIPTKQDWQKIRGGTPIRDLQAWAQAQLPVGSVDPAFPSLRVTAPAQADHIVSVDRIRRMSGFAALDDQRQLTVLNMPENVVALSPTANQSKGGKSFAEWSRQESLNLPVDETIRQTMIARERELIPMIQERINQLLREQLAAQSTTTPAGASGR